MKKYLIISVILFILLYTGVMLGKIALGGDFIPPKYMQV